MYTLNIGNPLEKLLVTKGGVDLQGQLDPSSPHLPPPDSRVGRFLGEAVEDQASPGPMLYRCQRSQPSWLG